VSAEPLDRRLHAWRDDLADARLKGRVKAAAFVEGRPHRIAVPFCDLRRTPSDDGGVDTQLLMGEAVRVFDRSGGWAWVQAAFDGYVGYLPESVLTPDDREEGEPPLRVVAPWAFLFSGPDIKRPVIGSLPMGARFRSAETVEHGGRRFFATGTGGPFVLATSVGEADAPATDYVSVAETMRGTPYLWGGRTPFGIDCSGIVQLAMMMAGMRAPRDSDMQEAGLGRPLAPDAPLRRGDLVFWKGHVGIMRDGETLLHANAHSMDVASEPLAQAIERIATLYGQPTSRRRPEGGSPQ